MVPESYSPSTYHRRLLDRTRPALRFAGQPFAAWKAGLRTRLRTLLGIDALDPFPPLAPRTLWEREHPLGTVRKLVFTSEVGADVPAYLCLPHGPGPHPCMIALQGHTTGMHVSLGVQQDDEQTPIAAAGDRAFGPQCMARGVAAFCMEQRSFGERAERRQEQLCRSNGCHDAAMRSLLLGRTLAGERVTDVLRAAELLRGLPGVDGGRIGVMGQSGGGTISIYSAAVSDGFALVMPCCSFCTYRDSIASIYHCADNYLPGLLRLAEHGDVLGLIAPSPLVVINGRTDPIFPLEPARTEFAHAAGIYAAAGAAGRCAHVIGEGGHDFYMQAGFTAAQRVAPEFFTGLPLDTK